jgi:hypothetical protein
VVSSRQAFQPNFCTNFLIRATCPAHLILFLFYHLKYKKIHIYFGCMRIWQRKSTASKKGLNNTLELFTGFVLLPFNPRMQHRSKCARRTQDNMCLHYISAKILIICWTSWQLLWDRLLKLRHVHLTDDSWSGMEIACFYCVLVQDGNILSPGTGVCTAIYRVYLKGVAKVWGWFLHTTNMKKVHINMGPKNPPFRVRALFFLSGM